MMNRQSISAFFFSAILLCSSSLALASSCASPFALQVLGSGGPELAGGRASTSYLLWHKGKAKLLLDLGAGSYLRFNEAKADIIDLEVVLLSHLHVDHVADLPALAKSAWFTARQQDLPIYGPEGNWLMPSTTDYVASLFDKATGSYRYLNDFVSGNEHQFQLKAGDLASKKAKNISLGNMDLQYISTHHGPIPSLAWRVKIDDKVITFAGDMSEVAAEDLTELAKNTDVLVINHAIPETAGPVAKSLHMPPSIIGKVAKQSGTKMLLLSHRMQRTIGQEAETLAEIRNSYDGEVMFADDLMCLAL